MKTETHYMAEALKEARKAFAAGEVPVGAVLVDAATGEIVARAANLTETNNDPSAHAELLAIRDFCAQKGEPRLPGYDLYVTLEPCPMCAAVISFARIRRLYYGAYDPKSGGVDHGPRLYTHPACHHKPEVYGGIDETACGEILKEFFKGKR
jgi:tRNA(adenine34) deaminase